MNKDDPVLDYFVEYFEARGAGEETPYADLRGDVLDEVYDRWMRLHATRERIGVTETVRWRGRSTGT